MSIIFVEGCTGKDDDDNQDYYSMCTNTRHDEATRQRLIEFKRSYKKECACPMPSDWPFYLVDSFSHDVYAHMKHTPDHKVFDDTCICNACRTQSGIERRKNQGRLQ